MQDEINNLRNTIEQWKTAGTKRTCRGGRKKAPEPPSSDIEPATTITHVDFDNMYVQHLGKMYMVIGEPWITPRPEMALNQPRPDVDYGDPSASRSPASRNMNPRAGTQGKRNLDHSSTTHPLPVPQASRRTVPASSPSPIRFSLPAPADVELRDVEAFDVSEAYIDQDDLETGFDDDSFDHSSEDLATQSDGSDHEDEDGAADHSRYGTPGYGQAEGHPYRSPSPDSDYANDEYVDGEYSTREGNGRYAGNVDDDDAKEDVVSYAAPANIVSQPPDISMIVEESEEALEEDYDEVEYIEIDEDDQTDHGLGPPTDSSDEEDVSAQRTNLQRYGSVGLPVVHAGDSTGAGAPRNYSHRPNGPHVIQSSSSLLLLRPGKERPDTFRAPTHPPVRGPTPFSAREDVPRPTDLRSPEVDQAATTDIIGKATKGENPKGAKRAQRTKSAKGASDAKDASDARHATKARDTSDVEGRSETKGGSKARGGSETKGGSKAKGASDAKGASKAKGTSDAKGASDAKDTSKASTTRGEQSSKPRKGARCNLEAAVEPDEGALTPPPNTRRRTRAAGALQN
ncbi:hypothetical protein ACG7TL_003412 [Trametes sanguinea]